MYSVMQGVALEDTYNVLTVPVGGISGYSIRWNNGVFEFRFGLRYPEVFRDGQRKSF
ncbi:MAG: hypothetical protein ACLTZT_10475 [Butyricimonas faecalis]